MIDIKRLANRYQNQSWLVRRWHDRHLLLVPWVAFRIWNFGQSETFGIAWSIALGLCDKDREFWYTWEEMLEMEAMEKSSDADESKNEHVIRVSDTELEQEIEDLAQEAFGVSGQEAIAMLNAGKLDGTLIEVLLEERLYLLGRGRNQRS